MSKNKENSSGQSNIALEAHATSKGERLDKQASTLFADYSRSQLQAWIQEGRLRVDGILRAADYKLRGGEHLTLQAAEVACEQWQPAPDVPVETLHEDAACVVINKPAGLVTHPGAGHQVDTLANGLLAKYPELQDVPRAGIVHRLDKDTSGLLVVARTVAGQEAFLNALKERRVSRQYTAVVRGKFYRALRIEAPIGRHSVKRQQMAVVKDGKMAVTQVEPCEQYEQYSLVRAILETGRTHQIRVHMAWKGYPLVGDALYGKRHSGANRMDRLSERDRYVEMFPRQALHADRLAFKHPVSGALLNFNAPLPADLSRLLTVLRQSVC